MTAALSEAQQQGEDVDGAGRLLGLFGTRRSSFGPGHSKLLGHWRGEAQDEVRHAP